MSKRTVTVAGTLLCLLVQRAAALACPLITCNSRVPGAFLLPGSTDQTTVLGFPAEARPRPTATDQVAASFDTVAAGGLMLQTRHISFFEPDDPPNKGRLALMAQAIAGAVNVLNRANTAQTDFAWLRGGGARAVYGLTGHASLEGSLTALSTGEAAFDDGSSTHATLARVLLGAMLHTGETYVPYVRAGLGVRMGEYTRKIGSQPSRCEFGASGFWSLAFGIDAWLGDSFVAGLATGYTSAGNDDTQMLEVNAHVGFAWWP